ncbi:MAG: hypothetical protein QM811_23465 [Pirellulales bacterium]
MYSEQRALYEKDPNAANKLLAVGATKPDAKLDPLDLAAATVVAQLIANFDDAVRFK